MTDRTFIYFGGVGAARGLRFAVSADTSVNLSKLESSGSTFHRGSRPFPGRWLHPHLPGLFLLLSVGVTSLDKAVQKHEYCLLTAGAAGRVTSSLTRSRLLVSDQPAQLPFSGLGAHTPMKGQTWRRESGRNWQRSASSDRALRWLRKIILGVTLMLLSFKK